MSFMPNQAIKVDKMMKGTHTKPAFCNQIWLLEPSLLLMVWASPPKAPNKAKVMTMGTTNCTTDTPKFPKPALMPKALPFSALGKKKLMLDMDELKLAPPKPHNKANTTMVK